MAGDRHALCEEDQFILGGCSNPMPFSLAQNLVTTRCTICIWEKWTPCSMNNPEYGKTNKVNIISKLIWDLLLKKTIDTMPPFHNGGNKSAHSVIRDHFMKVPWDGAYDFVEFVVKNSNHIWSQDLIECVNKTLERENSAYRIIGKEIVEITDENEIEAIESVIEKGKQASARMHIQQSLELLSDRQQPDYRNSIKEAISAVESVCQAISGRTNGTLSGCLEKLAAQTPIHPSFKEALKKLYGYTSDGNGIRHAISDVSENPSFADAKFMLVACSAFCNFLWTKAAENGIELAKD
jgi:hypothetical protein